MKCEFCETKRKVHGYKLRNGNNIAICENCYEELKNNNIKVIKNSRLVQKIGSQILVCKS